MSFYENTLVAKQDLAKSTFRGIVDSIFNTKLRSMIRIRISSPKTFAAINQVFGVKSSFHLLRQKMREHLP